MSQYQNPYEPPHDYADGPLNYQRQPSNQTPTVLAVISLCTGLAGIMSCLCCFLIPLPLISLGCGIGTLAMEHDSSAKIMAIIGITFSSLMLIFWFCLLVFGAINEANHAIINPPRGF